MNILGENLVGCSKIIWDVVLEFFKPLLITGLD